MNRTANPTAICCICRRPRRQAWTLSGYYGIGTQYDGRGKATVAEPCCALCFASVSHNAHGQPNYPKRYKRALRRYTSYQITHPT